MSRGSGVRIPLSRPTKGNLHSEPFGPKRGASIANECAGSTRKSFVFSSWPVSYAWRAASDLRGLTQFVRIALMRQRVSLVSRNLSKDEAEIALFLLELERPQEALLRVWDGDRAICGQVAFAQFCLYHKKLIGRPPSPDVMRQGLRESLTSGLSPNTHGTYYRACAYASDPVSLLVHIEGLLWKQSDRSRSQVRHLDSQQSAAVRIVRIFD